jgi:hypothetical protein
MPYLNGTRVQHRMAKLGFRYVKPLAVATGLPYGNLRNAITSRKPLGHDHPLHLANVYVLAEALRGADETVEDVVADIVATEGEGVPDPPPAKKTKDTQGPARRQDTEKKTGPQRANDTASAA